MADRWKLTLTLAFAALLVACGDGGPAMDGMDVGALAPLTLVEELRIGSVDDPDLGFSRIGGVQVASGGGVVVLEQQDRQIRVYGPEGDLLRVIGRQGSGPGELESPSGLGLRGDTIWVGDRRTARLTLFDLDGNVLVTVPAGGVTMPVPGVNARVMPAYPRGDGRYGSELFAASEGMSGIDSARVPALVFDSTGAVVDTAGTHFLPRSAPTQIVVENMGVLLPRPLYDWPLLVPFGTDTVEVRRETATSAAAADFTLTLRAAGGDTSYHTRLRYTPVAVDADSLVAETVRRYYEGAANRSVLEAAIRDAVPPATFYPPVVRHLAGDDGSVWLQREDVGGDSLRWLVVRPDGTPRGEVLVPRSAALMWVSAEMVWLVERDQLDVPWLVRRRVEG